MWKRELRVGGLVVAVGLVAAVAGGCSDRPTILPSSDWDLRKTNAEFAADAAKRSYPGEAPQGGPLAAQADVDYGFANRIQVINLSDEDWKDVDVWVNGTYVVHLQSWPKKQMKTIPFAMLFDRDAHTFPTNNTKMRVQKLEVAKDGKLFEVPFKLAE